MQNNQLRLVTYDNDSCQPAGKYFVLKGAIRVLLHSNKMTEYKTLILTKELKRDHPGSGKATEHPG